MARSQTSHNLTSIAYVCFLFPGIISILLVADALLPFQVMEPAYFGFFVVMPLALVVAITTPAAMIITFKVGRSEPRLVALATATMLVPCIAVIANVLDSPFNQVLEFLYYAAGIIHFLLAIVFAVLWFVRKDESAAKIARSGRQV